jgi:hypothetical protein
MGHPVPALNCKKNQRKFMITTRKARIADWLLLISTIVFLLENGAALWESFNVIPLMSQAPPASFYIFQGEYGLRYANFWIGIHSLLQLLLIAAIILNWKHKARRKMLLIVFTVFILVRVWTILYFAPTIMSFWDYPYSQTIDETLRAKAKTWESLSLVRTSISFVLAFVMIPYNRDRYEVNA